MNSPGVSPPVAAFSHLFDLLQPPPFNAHQKSSSQILSAASALAIDAAIPILSGMKSHCMHFWEDLAERAERALHLNAATSDENLMISYLPYQTPGLFVTFRPVSHLFDNLQPPLFHLNHDSSRQTLRGIPTLANAPLIPVVLMTKSINLRFW